MHILGQQRQNSGLREDNKSRSGDRSQDGWLFLEAKQRPGASTDSSHDHFQRTGGGARKISLTREYGSQFGQDLGSEQWRPVGYERVGQILVARTSRAAQGNSLDKDEKELRTVMVNKP